jgi:hypothetical protein
MKVIVKALFTIGTLLSLANCSIEKSPSVLKQAPRELTDSEKTELRGLLEQVFVNPNDGEKPTDDYAAHLEYLKERSSITTKIIEATDDGSALIFVRNLKSLDQDYALQAADFKRVIEKLTNYQLRVYGGQSSYDRIKTKFPEAYSDWETDRDKIVEKMRAQRNDVKLRMLAGQLKETDSLFQTRFLWLVAKL